ncbi:MAG: class I SAM-dependent methyltransferase [Psychroflexus sp.]|nr:class I SAM-dependent methyltransferase [Psychroflexus sp.]MDN6310642.1 class I SAM-dependent methyltransferase [Psychroflexus sp.]
MHPKDYMDSAKEQMRYETHNNDIHDKRYQKFVSPITKTVEKNFSTQAKGIDFGCGTGPVATHVLQQKGFKNIALYDPYFHNHPEVFKEKYDFIMCCEVMEHFYQPQVEFKKLRQLLKPGGQLLCKTRLFLAHENQTDFEKWHYKDDKTHVFFYGEKSLAYIKDQMGFKTLDFNKKLIQFGL